MATASEGTVPKQNKKRSKKVQYLNSIKEVHKTELTMDSNIQKKVVIVGDDNCGKTSLGLSFKLKDKFDSDTMVPTLLDNFWSEIHLPNCPEHKCELNVWDTIATHRLRPLSYPNTDVVLICFSVISQDSFENVLHQWAPEIQEYCPKIPYILVGCHADLRNNPDNKDAIICTTEDGRDMADTVGAYAYMECSARSGEGVREIFQESVYAALASDYVRQNQSNKNSCSIQ